MWSSSGSLIAVVLEAMKKKTSCQKLEASWSNLHSHVLQRIKGHPKKQMQNRMTTTPRLEQKRTASTSWTQQLKSQSLDWELNTVNSCPPPQTETIPLRWMPQRHRSSNRQPHPAVLSHLRRFETPDMPSPVDALKKLWGPVETLRRTADLLTGLKI